jgi:hypothetical protein
MAGSFMPSDRHREAARILRIAHRDFKAWIAALEHEYPRTHDLALLCRLVMDFGGDPSPYLSLENFTPFGARLRYEDEQEPLNLNRDAWNQLCAELLAHGASLIP